MAINAYVGLQGSGKSYEAVASVVLPALASGRRVVTNIDGLNEALCLDHLEKKGGDPAKFGSVVHVTNERVVEPDFFPDEEEPDRDSVVRGGDVVVIDEAWRYWSTGDKITHEHMQFFRMHRHYTHEKNGVSCDLVLLVQSIGDLHRSLRSVVELTVKTTKLKTIGMKKTFRVELFEGGRGTKSSKFATHVKRYDPAIFPLYKSYAAANGQEQTVDGRQNALTSPWVWAGMATVVVIGGLSFWFLMGLKSRFSSKVDHTTPVEESFSPGPTAGAGGSSGGGISKEWRVAGEVVIRGERYVVLSDTKGHMRFEPPGAFVGRGWTLVGTVEGERVAFWTGAPLVAPAPSPVPGVLK